MTQSMRLISWKHIEVMNIWPHTSQICRKEQESSGIACVCAGFAPAEHSTLSKLSFTVRLKAVYPHYIKEKCLPPIDPVPSQSHAGITVIHAHLKSSFKAIASTALKTMTYSICTQSILNVSLIQHCMFHPADIIQHSMNCMNTSRVTLPCFLPFSLNYSGMCLASDTQFSDFLDGMGPAQFVGRQTLATTSMGEYTYTTRACSTSEQAIIYPFLLRKYGLDLTFTNTHFVFYCVKWLYAKLCIFLDMHI